MKLSNFCKIAIISASLAVFIDYLQTFPSVFSSIFLNCSKQDDFPYEPYRIISVWWIVIPFVAIAVGFLVGKKENHLLDRFFELSISALGISTVLYKAMSGWGAIHPCVTNQPFAAFGAVLSAVLAWFPSFFLVAIALGTWWFLSRKK